MEKRIEDIITEAKKIGACNSADGITTWRELIAHFFSAQGREFCRKHNFPGIDDFRAEADEIRQYNVFVDTDVHECNKDVAIVGNSTACLDFSGTDKAYKVIIMHNAKAFIKAGKYAVVRVDNISGSCRIENDGTAIITGNYR